MPKPHKRVIRHYVCNNICEDSYCDWYSYVRRTCSLKKEVSIVVFEKLILDGSCPIDCPRFNELKLADLREQRRLNLDKMKGDF